ncbi:MAG: helicase-related protein [Gemmatimonas sp.]
MIRARSPNTWHDATPHQVRSAIATEMQRTEGHQSAPQITVGTITLRPHQRDALVRLRNVLARFGGALLADEVGLGKTYTALALAQDYEHVDILAPAALLPMWRSAIGHTQTEGVTLHSIHRLSRREFAHFATRPVATTRTLVIIDEAHHLRTRTTRRFSNAAALTAGCDVLLMSATPVHNRRRELRTLLSLFLGNRADAIDDNMLAQCIVRRTVSVLASTGIPTVREHPPLALTDNHAVLESILTLTPPLPLADGSAPSALVRLGLLRAWCSSDAALSEAIRRRQLRGQALLHSLGAGRLPNQHELQSWLMSHDSIQLGFPELLIAADTTDTDAMSVTVRAHLDGLRALLDVHTRTSVADQLRSELLRSLAADTGNVIVAFSQFAATVRALHRALSDIAGVAMLTANSGQIASGRIPREELIANFAPTANGRPPPPAHQRIRLLITTDLLAEGVNLQDANTVVHLDLPWTHALRQQRVGRIARMGSAHNVVDVHAIAPPLNADRALGLIRALQHKAGLHARLVGHTHGAVSAETHPGSGADVATALREMLQRWSNAPASESATNAGAELPTGFPVAAMPGDTDGFIACVYFDHAPRLVAGWCDGFDNPPLTDDNLATVLQLAHSANPSGTSEPIRPANPRTVDVAIDSIERWLNNRQLAALAGDSTRALSRTQHQLRDTLASAVAALPAMTRHRLSAQVQHVERAIAAIRGAGAEHNIGRWIREARSLRPAEWIAQFPVGSDNGPRRSNSQAPVGGDPDGGGGNTQDQVPARSLIRALLIVQKPRAQ